jgi:hypothetical protein
LTEIKYTFASDTNIGPNQIIDDDDEKWDDEGGG